MLRLENPQEQAMEYTLHIHRVNVNEAQKGMTGADWSGVEVPLSVQLVTDPRTPLKQYY